LDEGNFDVGKDFHNGELIPIDDIPYDETPKDENGHGYKQIEVED